MLEERGQDLVLDVLRLHAVGRAALLDDLQDDLLHLLVRRLELADQDQHHLRHDERSSVVRNGKRSAVRDRGSTAVTDTNRSAVSDGNRSAIGDSKRSTYLLDNYLWHAQSTIIEF